MNLGEMFFVDFGHFIFDRIEFFEKGCNLSFIITFEMRQKIMIIGLCIKTLVIPIENLSILILL